MPGPVLALRQQLGLNQTEMGEELGLSQPRVSELEASDVVPGHVALILWERWKRQLRRLGWADLESLMRKRSAA